MEMVDLLVRIIKENTFIFSNIIENQYAGFLLLFLSISFFILSLNLKIKEISIIILFPYFIIRKILIIFKGKKKITNILDDCKHRYRIKKFIKMIL